GGGAVAAVRTAGEEWLDVPQPQARASRARAKPGRKRRVGSDMIGLLGKVGRRPEARTLPAERMFGAFSAGRRRGIRVAGQLDVAFSRHRPTFAAAGDRDRAFPVAERPVQLL